MKHKNVAGVLAFFAGYMGLHRFYLGQVGLGIAYIFLIPALIAMGFWGVAFIGVLDAVIFFSMDQKAFNAKYNPNEERLRNKSGGARERQRNRDEQRQKQPQRQRNKRYETVPNKSKMSRAKSGGFLKEGIREFKEYDYEAAIENFEKALLHDPQHVATHFNLACAQSLMENKDKAFYHLDRAVALGFHDFGVIKNRDHLAFIRIQPEFEQFEANGFRLAKQMNTTQDNQLNSDMTKKATPTQSPDLLEQLSRLAQLKEKGLLTEQEFSSQKEKLLR